MGYKKRSAMAKLRQFTGLGALGGAVCGGILLYKGDESAFTTLMSVVARFTNGETGHRLAVWSLSKGIHPVCRQPDDPALQVKLWNLTFPNPVGVAAGFDKGAEAVTGLASIGFGFIEVGSVTPLAQDGNPKPRVFRLPEDQAVINRYGFNSEGHEVVKSRLMSITGLPNRAVLGVNLGKNKESVSAAKDYCDGVIKLGPLADYLVVNISSPNTPGLRSLQAKEELASLLGAVLKARNSLAVRIPLLIKIAPDLSQAEMEDIAEVVTSPETCIDGLIVSNTSLSREGLTGVSKDEAGGLSGAPISEMSTKAVSEMYRLTNGSLPIIGAGGIQDGKDAWEKVLAGASLVQLYTAMVYQGPPVAGKIRRELSSLLAESPFSTLQEAVGANHRANNAFQSCESDEKKL